MFSPRPVTCSSQPGRTKSLAPWGEACRLAFRIRRCFWVVGVSDAGPALSVPNPPLTAEGGGKATSDPSADPAYQSGRRPAPMMVGLMDPPLYSHLSRRAWHFGVRRPGGHRRLRPVLDPATVTPFHFLMHPHFWTLRE
ncbi:hypothetical protein NDU88_000257 [Pleurodeles waltl]|uniref:Uncharacterized protein n=1 Tax=Pleurodeles waltl TaxID=8319 RepID=A0AAV7TF83_PLEWA|nr:hypothetical protein NDU88_000257 [Pleurodeles waltl]